ncbi:MAG TPA: hypothetical protein VI195_10855 [Steroidobacteraceae bacterium]
MTMMQLIIGAALGFVVAQSGLYGIRHSLGWLQREEVSTRVRTLPGHVIVGGFIRYAAPIGATAALITLAVWGVGDYLAARTARDATLANALDSAASAGTAQVQGSADESSVASASAPSESASSIQSEGVDPYADPDYKVHRRVHRTGSPVTLKETLLQRSEAKARSELLQDMQQHAARSQYDCEAADRAARYLKAGLDVWGFGAWQLKYFPVEGYKGATLGGCKDIPNVVDPSQLNLQSTVAQENHS